MPLILIACFLSPVNQDIQSVRDRMVQSLKKALEHADFAGLMSQRLDVLARETKLPDKKLDELKDAVPDTVKSVINELAGAIQNDEIKPETGLLIVYHKRIPEVFELTKAWRGLFEKVLTDNQFEKWEKLQKARATEINAKVTVAHRAAKARAEAFLRAPVGPDGVARAAPGGNAGWVPIRQSNGVMLLRSRIARAKLQYQQALDKKLAELRVLCDLTDGQSRKLALGTKGALKRRFDPIEAELAEIQDDEKPSEELLGSIKDLQAAFYEESLAGSTVSTSKEFEFWDKAVHKTLTEQQRNKLEAEQEARRSFEAKAWAYQVVVSFNNATSVSAQQREQAMAILSKLTRVERNSPVFTSGTGYGYYAGLPQRVQEALGKILTPRQIQSIRAPSIVRSRVR